MKTLFKVLALSTLLTASAVLTFAQDEKPTLEALYAQFRKEAPKKCGGRSAGLVTGKKIIELYGNDEPNKDVIKFVRDRMAEIEKEDPVCERENAYIAAFNAKNWNDVFKTDEVIINAEGDNPKGIDIRLDLVQVGYDRAYGEKNDAFNAKTLALAKSTLDAINAGKTSNSGKYGAFAQFGTKEAAQSWLNYIIGWQMYYKMNQQKEALPYLYKATLVSNEKKNDTTIYTNIGKFYFEEAARLYDEYTAKRKANNNEDNDETKALLALSRGYADRASDAFGRAYIIAKADPKLKTLQTNIAKTLTDLYVFRFQVPSAKQTDIDAYVNGLTSKTMPDPATPVTPVVEATPTTTTTSTTSTSLNTTNAAATSATPTPAATTNSSKTTPTTKTTVKKPVKKKGTR